MDKSFIDNSSSGIVPDDDARLSPLFTERTEIPTQGFNTLTKANRFGKSFMLKGLKPEYAGEERYRQLLRKEFDILASMNHPAIVQAVGWEKVEGLGTCIIMEYVDGVTLKDFLKTRPAKNIRRKIAEELMDAIRYIHTKQTAHRDLKPSNILITTNGQNVKLIDFGLSDTDTYQIFKQPAGTATYISPEQERDPVADCRNDVYSFGCILRDLHLGGVYTAVAHHCCLSIEKRYQNMVEVIADVTRRRRRHRFLLWTIVLLVVVACFGFLFASLRPARQERIAQQHLQDSLQILLRRQQAVRPVRDTVMMHDTAANGTMLTPADPNKPVNDAIKKGEKIIDKTFHPYQHYCDTVSSLANSNNEYSVSLIQRNGDAIDQYIRTLKPRMDASSLSVVTNALYVYLGNKYQACNKKLSHLYNNK